MTTGKYTAYSLLERPQETPLKLAILPVSLEALAGALHLPKEYTFLSLSYDEQTRTVAFLLSGDPLPEVEEGGILPTADLWVALETHPEIDPSYRRIKVEVRV